MKTPTLETKRLILHPLSLNDVEHIYKSWTSDPDVAKYMIWNLHESINDTLRNLITNKKPLDAFKNLWTT